MARGRTRCPHVPELVVALVLVRHEVELDALPGVGDVVEALLDGQLLHGGARDLVDLLVVLVEAPLDDALQRELVRRAVEAAARLRLDLLPVPRPHRLVLEVADERHGAPELVHLVLARLQDLPVLVLCKFIHTMRTGMSWVLLYLITA